MKLMKAVVCDCISILSTKQVQAYLALLHFADTAFYLFIYLFFTNGRFMAILNCQMMVSIFLVIKYFLIEVYALSFYT